jgi:diacylglycerol kinase (ATP)
VRWTAVVNPAAGRGRTRKLLPQLERALRERDVAVHVSSDIADGRRAAREAFDRGEGVVACGGDGTVSALAGLAAAQEAPLALVPTGAGNDLARHLGIDPKRPIDALSLLDGGRIARIDLGRAHAADGTTEVFTTVANTGFDAEANRWANEVRWARGTTLYVLALLRTVVTYRPRPVCVRVDDTTWEGSAWLVAVGNTRGYAGGMMITPRAEVDDGLLDVCIVDDGPILELLWRFPRVFRGTHTALNKVITRRGATVEISTPDDQAELWASGERVGPLPARLTTMAASLPILVPARPSLPRR